MPRLTTLVLGFIAATLCGSLFAASAQPTIQSLNRMPLAFTQNKGQWDERVLFRANAGGATMWFTKEGVTYQFTRHIGTDNTPLNPLSRGDLRAAGAPNSYEDIPLLRGDSHSSSGIAASEPIPLLRGARGVSYPDSVDQLVLTAKFVGANPNPEVVTEGQMDYKCNYFLGNDPTKWRTDVPNYEAITLKDIYPGIDLKYSSDGNSQAVYEFIATADIASQGRDIPLSRGVRGVSFSQIKVEYEGAKATLIDADGRMVVITKWGDMIAAIKSPVSSPLPVGEGSGVRAVLSGTACFSQLSEKTIGFGANGSSGQALGTLAVELIYSTYLGGGSGDQGNGIAVDDSGNTYVTGGTGSSDFPTLNPYQTYQGADVFVTKLSNSGNSLIYSTYLGGVYYSDVGNSIAVDDNGNAYVTGNTMSSDFPTLNPYQATYQGAPGDAFVAKLSSTGISLIYSTYLGGSDWEWGTGIAVDGSGNAYVTGMTTSSNFPTSNPYLPTFRGGYADAFVTAFSGSGNSLIYSTYLGGVGYDEGRGIAVNGIGNAYVTGYTQSSNFPTVNPYQRTFQGTYNDAFVTKLSSSGNSLVYSTYLGGVDDDFGNGIALGGSGNAYVTGYTYSSDFPTLNPYQTGPIDNYDAFVTKFSSSGSTLMYSTYLGGGSGDIGQGIAVDVDNAYVTGQTWSTDFPTQNPFQTYQGANGHDDTFVTKLSSSGYRLTYSTYLGGGHSDHGSGIAVDGNGNAYVSGRTSSSDFPTENPYQMYQGPTNHTDAFVTKLYFDPANDVSDEMIPVSLPEKAALDQNYPNPFNPSTEIGFDLPKPSFVSLDIFDVLGRNVSTLINEQLTAGSKRVQWNGRDNTGAEVASGVYFYRLQIGDHVEVKKMVLLK